MRSKQHRVVFLFRVLVAFVNKKNEGRTAQAKMDREMGSRRVSGLCSNSNTTELFLEPAGEVNRTNLFFASKSVIWVNNSGLWRGMDVCVLSTPTPQQGALKTPVKKVDAFSCEQRE